MQKVDAFVFGGLRSRVILGAGTVAQVGQEIEGLCQVISQRPCCMAPAKLMSGAVFSVQDAVDAAQDQR